MARKKQKAEGYRYEATTVEGFLQQLTCYIRCRYWFYVMGEIREGKDVRPIDEAIIERYGIAVSKYTRYRDKACHRARIQYLRFGRTYLILATSGSHDFFQKEKNIRDVERVPIKFLGHSITHENGGVRVRIQRERLKDLRAYFVDVATKRRSEDLRAEFWNLLFEPYGPVRKQQFGILKEVNELRKASGMEKVPTSAIRWRRRKVKPFEPGEESRWPKAIAGASGAGMGVLAATSEGGTNVTAKDEEVLPREVAGELSGLAEGCERIRPGDDPRQDGSGA